MTIIIAGLYENGKGAVIVGDKLRTGSHPLDKEEVLIERDDITKIYKLNNQVTVATSGDMEMWGEILKDIHEAVKDNDDFPKVRTIIERIYHKHFSRFQWSRMPGFLGFTDMEDYLKRGPKIMSQAQIDSLNARFINTVASGEMILVGKGKEKYEIYALSDPGIFKYGSMSSALTGSGMPYANRYFNENYRADMSMEEVKTVLLEAKKLAEADKNVGSMTDVKILSY
ncbi:hypothetical protein EPN95_01755 [Patescibacteria group bacterium]|nr:MAG: hypothetical protein EPN95_01755 [Patescibacteria group bacterium]